MFGLRSSESQLLNWPIGFELWTHLEFKFALSLSRSFVMVASKAPIHTNRRSVDALLGHFQSLPFDDGCAEGFANIRQFLEGSGLLIGPYDLQIAAIAKANQCILVTHNTEEFVRVPGLVLEDWQIP